MMVAQGIYALRLLPYGLAPADRLEQRRRAGWAPLWVGLLGLPEGSEHCAAARRPYVRPCTECRCLHDSHLCTFTP